MLAMATTRSAPLAFQTIKQAALDVSSLKQAFVLNAQSDAQPRDWNHSMGHTDHEIPAPMKVDVRETEIDVSSSSYYQVRFRDLDCGSS